MLIEYEDRKISAKKDCFSLPSVPGLKESILIGLLSILFY